MRLYSATATLLALSLACSGPAEQPLTVGSATETAPEEKANRATFDELVNEARKEDPVLDENLRRRPDEASPRSLEVEWYESVKRRHDQGRLTILQLLKLVEVARPLTTQRYGRDGGQVCDPEYHFHHVRPLRNSIARRD